MRNLDGVGGALCLLAGLAMAACGSRDPDLDAPIEQPSAVALNGALALADDGLSRVLVIESTAERALSATPVPVGRNIVSMSPDISGERLLVLSSGVQPRRKADDELPSLSLIDARETPELAARYELAEPFSALTLDPLQKWVVLSGAGETFVTNPNQLLLIDLTDPNFEPVTKTIRSFGAAPERFSFTEALDVPGGARRYLVVETRQDVTLVDLEDLSRPEITIGLPQTPTGAAGRPLSVVVHPGTDAAEGDARLAIRLENDPNVVLVQFTPAEEVGASFNLTLNLVDVGAPPAEISFVDTDGGLRLAALVPARREGALIEPETTRVERVSLPAPFNRLQRVSDTGASAGGADVALLWSQNSASVAFWSLGRTSDRAFRSVDVLNLDARVLDVLDVPGATFGHRKLLSAENSRFFVLDLSRRQSFPMLSSGDLELTVAPDGMRAWAFVERSTRFAQIDLETLQPTSLQIDEPIDGLFDIEAGDAGERTLIALHQGGALAATVMDAKNPDTAATRFIPALLLGGL